VSVLPRHSFFSLPREIPPPPSFMPHPSPLLPYEDCASKISTPCSEAWLTLFGHFRRHPTSSAFERPRSLVFLLPLRVPLLLPNLYIIQISQEAYFACPSALEQSPPNAARPLLLGHPPLCFPPSQKAFPYSLFFPLAFLLSGRSSLLVFFPVAHLSSVLQVKRSFHPFSGCDDRNLSCPPLSYKLFPFLDPPLSITLSRVFMVVFSL